MEYDMNSARFNLLMLDEGEYYIDDFVADYSRVESPNAFWRSATVKGRLKLCTASLFFVPEDTSVPVMRFPYADVSIRDLDLEVGFGATGNSFSFKSDTVVEMAKDELVYPYVFTKGMKKHVFGLRFTEACDVIKQLRRFIEIKDTDLHDWPDTPDTVRIITPLSSQWASIAIDETCITLNYFTPRGHVEKKLLSKLTQIYRRPFQIFDNAMELFFGEESLFIVFANYDIREETMNRLLSSKATTSLVLPLPLSELTLQWQKRELSTYQYLTQLNLRSGRSRMNLSQYPVFPWVLSDYTSKEIDLTRNESFRDLSLPMGAIGKKRKFEFMHRYEEMPSPKYLYSTHFSTPAYVVQYLVRVFPQRLLRLQGGKFDKADRTFTNVARAWTAATEAPADVRELIPEFYERSDFLVNSAHLPLGMKADGAFANDVTLPPWASSPDEFTSILREALESDYVSENIHYWINLIFGVDQRNLDKLNVFSPLTYPDTALALYEQASTDAEKRVILSQITEFGQFPLQLFKQKHPKRSDIIADMMKKELTMEKLLSTPEKARPAAEAASNAALLQEHGEAHKVENASAVATPESNLKRITPLFLFAPHQSRINSIAVTSDGKIITVSKDKVIRVFKIEDYQSLCAPASQEPFKFAVKQIRSFASEFEPLCAILDSANENLLYYGTVADSVNVFTLSTARVESIKQHNDSVTAITQVGEWVVSGSNDTSVIFYRKTPTGISKVPENVVDFDNRVTALAPGEDGTVTVGTEDGSIITVSVPSGDSSDPMFMHGDVVTGIARIEGGTVSVSADGSIKGWDDERKCTIAKDIGKRINCVFVHRHAIILGCDGLVAITPTGAVTTLGDDGMEVTALCEDKNGYLFAGTSTGKVVVFG